MRFTERWTPVARRLVPLSMACFTASCSTPMPPYEPDRMAAGQPSRSATAAAAAAGPVEPAPMLPLRPARNWTEVQRRSAERLVEANPKGTYMSRAPDVLLAIPVIEIELNGDGSVRRLVVLRVPGQAKDTLQLALDAIKRAAPFGDVSHLPKPWKFTEVFLFDDDRRFKPRTLDE